MNTLRVRILTLMLMLGLGPPTLLILALRFLPGGLLPWVFYGILCCITIATALAVSGTIARPMSEALANFVALFRSNGKHKPRTWVPAEYYTMQEALNRILADNTSRVADVERTLNHQAKALADAESAAIRSLEVLHTVVEHSPDGIAFMHGDGHLALINDRAVEMLGLSEDLTHPGISAITWLEGIATKFSNASDLVQTLVQWQRGPSGLSELEAELTGPDHQHLTIRTIDVRRDGSTLLGRLWIFRDGIDARLATRRLQTSQKMESIGQLAGGIAHDFNNLLTAIRGNLTMASLIEDKKEAQDKLQIATRATIRAAELVKQLLGYSRKNGEAKGTTDIGHIVSETRGILRASLDPRIAIRTNVDPQIWHASADPVQLQQVLLNLCLNSRDALPETGGVIDISAFNVAAKPSATNGSSSAQDQITLRIRDNGNGIPADIRNRIFEPYFTTKSADKGTGLGLAMVRTIVEESGGKIEFDSEVGKGTEFRLYFPAATATSSETASPIADNTRVSDAAAASTAAAKAQRDTNTGTLLVVDDEAPVRSIAAQMLKYLGYTVIEASDGVEAIHKLTTATAPIDAVLLDVYMPKLSGRETYRAIRERGLDVPVIVCSGFSVEPSDFSSLLPANNRNARPVQVIQKPYSMESLARVVSRAVSHPLTPTTISPEEPATALAA